MKMKRGELILFFVVWAIFLAGAVCHGAAPKADTLSFSVTTDGAKLILTPSLPSKLRITTSGPSTAAGLVAIIVNGAPDFADFSVIATVNGAPVPPVPPVPPTPPIPPPVPVPTTLFGIVVEESKERTPAQAVVLLSPKVGALFKADGGQFRIVDPWADDGSRRDVGVAMRPYVVRAEALKIKPYLFIVSPDGTVYSEGLLPAKVADVETLVVKIRKGGKP